MLLFDHFAPLDSTVGQARALAPVDVSISERDVVLTMDLPGMTADDIDIQFLDGELIVRGERTRASVGEGSRWTHAERPFGAFERRIQLPRGIEPDAITASMDRGVLSLIVPKPERMRPRRLEIGSAG